MTLLTLTGSGVAEGDHSPPGEHQEKNPQEDQAYYASHQVGAQDAHAAYDEAAMLQRLAVLAADPSQPNDLGVNLAFLSAVHGYTNFLKAFGVTKKNVNQRLMDPNDQLFHGCMLLQTAVGSGRVETVLWLLKIGADPTLADAKGFSAIHTASYLGHLNVLRVLGVTKENVNHRVADPEEPGSRGPTTLDLAAGSGNFKVVQWLLASGADPALKDNDGYVAANYAAVNGHHTLSKMLLARANANKPIHKQQSNLGEILSGYINSLLPPHLSQFLWFHAAPGDDDPSPDKN